MLKEHNTRSAVNWMGFEDREDESRPHVVRIAVRRNWKCGDIKPQEEKITTRRTRVFHAFNASTQEVEVGRSL